MFKYMLHKPVSAKPSVYRPSKASKASKASRRPLRPMGTFKQYLMEMEAVCFDFDCTITNTDTFTKFAYYLAAKEGAYRIEDQINSLPKGDPDAKLSIINCVPTDIRQFLNESPPETRLTPGIMQLMKYLVENGTKIYVVSGGFRELSLPVTEYLGIPPENVFANRMIWQWDDETLLPTMLTGVDETELATKEDVLAMLKRRHARLAVIGDGTSDLEAAHMSLVDMFIGYGGVVDNNRVKAKADLYIRHWDDLLV